MESSICKSWCLDNGIIIYPIVWKEATPEDPPRLAIQVDYQGFKKTGDKIWSQKNKFTKKGSINMYKLIESLYCHYYKQNQNER